MQKRDELLRYLIINKTGKTTDIMDKLGMNENTFYKSVEYFVNCRMITFDRDLHIVSIVGYKPLDKRIEVSIQRLLKNPVFFLDIMKMPYFRKYYSFEKLKGLTEVRFWKVFEHYNLDEPVDFDRKEKLLDLVANDIGESKKTIREDFDKVFASLNIYAV